MKRSLIIGGSVGAVVLLVLAMFPSVVGAQKVKSTDICFYSIFLNEKKEKIGELHPLIWYPGKYIDILIWFVLVFIGLILDNLP